MSAPHILIWNRLPPTASGKSNLQTSDWATASLQSYRIFAFSSKAVHLEPRQLPGPAVPGLPCHVPEAPMGRKGVQGAIWAASAWDELCNTLSTRLPLHQEAPWLALTCGYRGHYYTAGARSFPHSGCNIIQPPNNEENHLAGTRANWCESQYGNNSCGLLGTMQTD